MDDYLKLVRRATEEYISHNKVLKVPENLPADFHSRRAGVFVTIFNGPDLRGCIGTYLPTRKSLAEEVIRNAVAACSEDYRFDPIRASELPRLRFEVSVLEPPLEMKDEKKHDPRIHGVLVVASDGRSGLLLPDLDGVDTTEKQLDIACHKGGIDRDKESAQIFEFTVEKHADSLN